jgi:hypothetical protein
MNTFYCKFREKLLLLSLGIFLFTGTTFAQIQNFSVARMVAGSTTEQVLDLTISLHQRWADLTPELRAQYEEVIRNWADGVYEMSNGGHLLGNIRIFSDSRFTNTADVRWNANLWPNAHLNGFITSSARRIEMSDAFSNYDITGDAQDRQEAGYTLAHETGHYVYSLRDEYVIQTGDVAVVPSIMNDQWNAPVNNFQWLNFSTSNNIGDVTKTNQGRTWGVSAWTLLVQNPTLDPAASLTNTGGVARRQYAVLNGRAPTSTNTWLAPNGTTFTWMSVQLPATRAQDSLRILWMGNTIDVDLVLDKSGSMTGQPLEDVKTASKAFVDAILNFSTAMQLTPAIGLTAFSTTPDNPPTYALTPLTSGNVATVNGLIDAMSASGQTAMYDAALISHAKLTGYSGENSTRLCMLLTDGEENNSVVTDPAQVIAPFVNSNIPIYTFGYGSGASHDNCVELAEGTHGRFFGNLTSMAQITDEWLRIFDNTADIQYAKDAVFSVASGLDFVVDPTVSAVVVQVTYELASASSYSTFTIRDNNNAIVPSTTHTIPLGTSYPRAEIALVSVASYNVAEAAKGNWKCIVNASDLVSTNLQGTVKLKGKETGTYSLTIDDMGKGYYTYPQPLHLTASVGNSGSISGVNVIARLTSPSGTVTDIPMYDDGTNGDPIAADGQYTSLYNGYKENGQYLFTVHIDNNDATGFYAVAGKEYAQSQSGTFTPPVSVPVTDHFVRQGRAIIHVSGYAPSTIDQIMGFEDASQWNFIFGSTGTLSNSTVTTGGLSSMQVAGNNFQHIRSIDINTDDFSTVTNKLAFDLFIGNNQPNQSWVGQVQLTINCPSAGINNQFIGAVELSGLPQNQFNTMTFNLPSNVINAMNGSYSDFSFSLELNTNSGSGPYYFDTMRFVP